MEEQCVGTGPMQVKEPSEVSRLMASLDAAVARLHSEILDLSTAISPALAPDTPNITEKAVPATPLESPIAQALADRLRGIEQANGMIQNLRQRIRL